MGVPYNFLQELSGIRRTTPPSEFDDSTRYIGTISQANYFFADESESFYSTLNLGQKRNGTNELIFNQTNLDALYSRRDSLETGYVSLSFPKNAFSKGAPETGNISISSSLAVFLFGLETGHISTSLSQSFTSGVADVSNIDLSFNYDFTESLGEEVKRELTFEAFIKKINKEYSSLDLVLSTGTYEGAILTSKNDYSNLGLIIFTGSYQGA